MNDLHQLPVTTGDIIENAVVVRKLFRKANNRYGNNNSVLCRLPATHNGRALSGVCARVDLIGMDFAECQQRFDALKIGDCLHPVYLSNLRVEEGKVFMNLSERYPMEEKALQTFRWGTKVTGTVIERGSGGILWMRFKHPELLGSWKGLIHYSDLLGVNRTQQSSRYSQIQVGEVISAKIVTSQRCRRNPTFGNFIATLKEIE